MRDFMTSLKDISIFACARLGYLPIIHQYEIKDFLDLKILIEAGESEFLTNFWLDELAHASRRLEDLKGEYLPVYSSTMYANNGFDPAIFSPCENNISASLLPITSPYNTSLNTNDRIKDFTVADVRAMLEKVTCYKKNGLCTVNGIGSSKVAHIFDTLQFFEEQMIRIANSANGSLDENSFFKDSALKRQAILDDIRNILITLFNMSDSFVWGSTSASVKEKLFACATTNKENAAKKKLLSYLSNYTTLEDYQNEQTLERALRRFTK